MILNDQKIRELISQGKLISQNANSTIKGASYELRTSVTYIDLTEDPHKIITADSNNKILIKPFHKVVLITEEILDIPNDILGRVTTKGQLFSIGLSAINTYADPGFKGNLGLVFYNFGHKYILLDIGTPIAKIDFSQLTHSAVHPYSGQHGFSAGTWIVPTRYQFAFEDIKNHSCIKGTALEDAYSCIPKEVTTAIKNLGFFNKWITGLIVGLLAINVFMAVLVSIDRINDTVSSVFINLLSSFIALVIGLIIKLGRKE